MPPGSLLIHKRVTPFQTLRVRERNGVRYLESGRIRQAAVRVLDGEPALQYIPYTAAAWLFQPAIRRMLVIGLGGGSVGTYLQRRIAGLAVDYVEIDPAVPAVARGFMGFREGPRTRVFHGDGRSFLRASRRTWDYILCDAFVGISMPLHFTTIQFLDEVRRRLAPRGVFATNLAEGFTEPRAVSVVRTLRQRFRSLHLLRVRGLLNILAFAGDGPELTKAELIAQGRAMDARWRFDPPLSRLAAHRHSLEVEIPSASVLSDEPAAGL